MISPLRRPTPARPVTLLALCGALLLAALLAVPGPAQAHDTLISTDPADGATLETSPEALTLTFSGDLLDVSPLVRISDESGAELAVIVPVIDGPVATATLPEPLPAGTHTVQWRVVSGDGHPLEGTLTLTVEQGPAERAAPGDGGEPAASDGGGTGQAPSEQAPSEQAPSEQAPPAESASGDGLPMPVLLGILAVVVLGAVAASWAILRRRD